MTAATLEETRARLTAALEGVELTFEEQRDGMACLRCTPEGLKDTLRALRDRAGFESVTLITAIDHHPQSPRFEIVHQLRSLEHGDRVRLLTQLPDDTAPRCTTCIDLWPGARFMEREVFDMFGVGFDGHAGIKRLLMPEGYGHHPLRKDFPQQGIEPDRLFREWDEARRTEWREEG